MKQDEILKIFGIIIVCFFIIYITIQIVYNPKKKMMEGLTNEGETVNSTNGYAGNAASYAAAIKAETVKFQDLFLISKYRKEYEAVIINLDEYLGYAMLLNTLSIDLIKNPNAITEELSRLNTIKQMRDDLNSTMTFLDKQ